MESTRAKYVSTWLCTAVCAGVLLATAVSALADPPCGAGAGDCCMANGTPGCDDETCCAAICAIDPFCCDTEWDSICAGEAGGDMANCPQCVIEPPEDCFSCANNEGEACGDRTNQGCNNDPPVFGQIEFNGASICGTLWATDDHRDTDWYLFTTTAPSTKVSLSSVSELPAVLFLTDGVFPVCGEPTLLGTAGFAGANCGAGAPATATVAAGTYVAFIAAGNPDGSGIFNGAPCNPGFNDYTISLTSVIVLPLEIKHGACPAPFNRSSNGVTPIAILSGGSEGVDAADINQSTVAISRCDGGGGSVAPSEGPLGPGNELLPVGTPTAELAECGGCACHDQSNDGLEDLSMHFSNSEMTETLELGDITDGATVPLKVTGELNDGTPFEAYDCIQLVPPGEMDGGGGQTAQLVVESNVSGAWVAVSPMDLTLDGGGFANFTRYYPLTTLVTVQMPNYQGSSLLLGWVIDGVYTPASSSLMQESLSVTSVKTTVEVAEISTFKAVYQPTKNLTPPVSNLAPSNGGPSIGG